MHRLDARTAAALHAFAAGEAWTQELADGHVHVVARNLPGRATVGVARAGDELWVVIDRAKPQALEHLEALMNTWPLGEVGDSGLSAVALDDIVMLMSPFLTGAQGRVPIRR